MIQYGANYAPIKITAPFVGIEVSPATLAADVLNTSTQYPMAHSVNNVSTIPLFVECELGAGVYTSSGDWDNPGLILPGESMDRSGYLVFDGDDEGDFVIVATYNTYAVDDDGNKVGDVLASKTFTMNIHVDELPIYTGTVPIKTKTMSSGWTRYVMDYVETNHWRYSNGSNFAIDMWRNGGLSMSWFYAGHWNTFGTTVTFSYDEATGCPAGSTRLTVAGIFTGFDGDYYDLEWGIDV